MTSVPSHLWEWTCGHDGVVSIGVRSEGDVAVYTFRCPQGDEWESGFPLVAVRDAT